jgi:hypothetical protein
LRKPHCLDQAHDVSIAGGEVEEKDEKIIDKAAEANKEAVAEVNLLYVLFLYKHDDRYA